MESNNVNNNASDNVNNNVSDDINKNDKSTVDSNDQTLDEIESFDDALYTYHDGKLLAGIYEYGFEHPSPIQSQAIPYILSGRDIIAQAQAGSGKTGAFLIPALANINVQKKYPQVMIIGNTRSLASQIEYTTKQIGTRLVADGLGIELCVGGQGKYSPSDLDRISKTQILIGTPGKFVSLTEQKNQSRMFNKISLLILDEADILLKDEFSIQMQKIIRKLPKKAQICLFSATYPESVLDLTNNFLRNPMKILVKNEDISVDGIKNYWVSFSRENEKYNALLDLYRSVNVCQAVIFVNSIESADRLSSRMIEAGHSVGVIHGSLDDCERVQIMEQFRKTHIRVLVATDIISRGIDVQQVGLVINYDVPYDPDKYIHRVGRSGRFGRTGVAITFVTSKRRDLSNMDNIVTKYNIQFNEIAASEDIEQVENYLTGSKQLA